MTAPSSNSANDLFTGILAEIAEVAGTAAALQLAHAKGGLERVYIPRPDNLAPGHWLVDLVGMEAALAIAGRLGGGHVEIPLGPSAGRVRQWRIMRAALAAGKSGAAAARAAGLHQRTVRRHRNGHSGNDGGDDGQGRLF
ncbi:conserved protein of unknown function (DNA binding 12-129) [Magnetospirillum sp. XM-1]|uniref:hypothetical protein n=1 Tax=Magnetospirillum sp. XM-1 TaxID=1663591 RepID=UPI00073DCAE6|nr:hypothetical protein [Magnetospirillum sp. XM-1]CUW41123.1 conserved protein of unknown function (DNA binding 12-129) [Magnetospirillum sp. XM-1]